MVGDKYTVIVEESVRRLTEELVGKIDDGVISRCVLPGLNDNEKRKYIALSIVKMNINRSVYWN